MGSSSLFGPFLSSTPLPLAALANSLGYNRSRPLFLSSHSRADIITGIAACRSLVLQSHNRTSVSNMAWPKVHDSVCHNSTRIIISYRAKRRRVLAYPLERKLGRTARRAVGAKKRARRAKILEGASNVQLQGKHGDGRLYAEANRKAVGKIMRPLLSADGKMLFFSHRSVDYYLCTEPRQYLTMVSPEEDADPALSWIHHRRSPEWQLSRNLLILGSLCSKEHQKKPNFLYSGYMLVVDLEDNSLPVWAVVESGRNPGDRPRRRRRALPPPLAAFRLAQLLSLRGKRRTLKRIQSPRTRRLRFMRKHFHHVVRSVRETHGGRGINPARKKLRRKTRAKATGAPACPKRRHEQRRCERCGWMEPGCYHNNQRRGRRAHKGQGYRGKGHKFCPLAYGVIREDDSA